MDSKNCKRLKRDDADGDSVTVFLAVSLLEEQIPGKETCSREWFEFRAALFLIDDIICGPLSLLQMQDIYSPTS